MYLTCSHIEWRLLPSRCLHLDGLCGAVLYDGQCRLEAHHTTDSTIHWNRTKQHANSGTFKTHEANEITVWVINTNIYVWPNIRVGLHASGTVLWFDLLARVRTWVKGRKKQLYRLRCWNGNQFYIIISKRYYLIYKVIQKSVNRERLHTFLSVNGLLGQSVYQLPI